MLVQIDAQFHVALICVLHVAVAYVLPILASNYMFDQHSVDQLSSLHENVTIKLE